ncbi:MAG TPA: ATP-binding protein, partial [Labilithrix sp.]|nr:ATP-binding protein [Labilithrix sp.]
MRSIDWSATPLGPVSTWPASLKTCVRIVLTSRQPMFVWWGDQLINLYNDAYKAIVGGKHPAALGQPASVVWREIWDQVGPRAATAMRENEGTYDEALLLLMERHGYREETYYTFSYSPVPNDQGGTGGLICANTDDTQRIIGERQLALLSDLGTRMAAARTWRDASALAARSIESNAKDLPFALIYVFDDEERRMLLAGAAGIADGHPAAPASVDSSDETTWPFAEMVKAGDLVTVDGLPERFGDLPTGPWDMPSARAALVPIAASGQAGRSGALVVGLNPFRLFDDGYKAFLRLVAGQVSASIANADAYEEERKRAEALAAIDRAKTAFFSNISHEFRTPLTLMLGPTEDALAATPRALHGAALETVHRNELRLLKLVNSLLDFSRIEAGRVQAEYRPTDLSLLTSDLASAFRSAVERGGLSFDVDCPPLSEAIYVDPSMWEKIVLNLLSNAFKFTFDGTVRIALRSAGDRIELVVADSGVGIPEHELGRVFERFHRIEGTRSRTHEGSGIGLALVRDLVELHGGDIRVESALGKGTTFTVRIRRGKAHIPPERIVEGAPSFAVTASADAFVSEALRWLPEGLDAPPSDAMRSGAPSSETFILVADDNADMREYVRRLLRPHWNVQTTSDGVEALEVARARRPDLVLTDVMMPNLDGFALLRALREDSSTAGVPVIMLSARAGEESRIDGLQAGADDYLVKPFSAKELIARVSTHIELGRLRRTAEQANRSKDEFLAMLGHELRNPLAPIVTALHLMRLRSGSAVPKELTVLERQVNHLGRLVDDLLDVSRITRGRVELRKEHVELADVVARGIEMAGPLFEQRRHELRVRVGRGLTVDADPARLAQIVSNLVTNAAKYTDPGGRVIVMAHRDGDQIVLEVADNGMGIPEALLPNLFEMFVQGRQDLDRSKGGLGLGLTIVRSLVSLHGGTVTARSAGPGQGSSFVVRLPASTARRASATSGKSEVPAAPRPATSRVLVVDDNEDAATALAEFVELLGCAVKVANDGAQALEAVAEFVPDVALVDLGLPVMDG